MELIIGIIVVLLILIIYGLVARKKIYEQIDKIEAWKIDITNRPVTDEISRVKDLNLHGQAEEKFEDWRQSWDDIITVKLPEIEDLLFDAEEAVDRYNFNKSKRIISAMNHELQSIEDEISTIINELNELVGSEEKNRVEIEELKFNLKKLKKKLITDRHQFGKAEVKLEELINETDQKFTLFTEATQSGNYFEARDIVLQIKSSLEDIGIKMDVIPKILPACKQSIPLMLQELREGHQEMLDNGYILEHLHISKLIDDIEKEALSCVDLIEKADVNEIETTVNDLNDRTDELYDLLENEVKAKHIVEVDTPTIQPILLDLKFHVQKSKQDAKEVQQSYQLSDEDIEVITKLEKSINQTVKTHQQLELQIAEKKYPSSQLKNELDVIKEQIETLKETHHSFCEMLNTLRKDELRATDEISAMKKKLFESKRLVQKSNLPGIPEGYIRQYEDVEGSIALALSRISEKPLDIPSVNHLIKEAKEAVDHIYEFSRNMIENAIITEKVIQYGNRYRTKYPLLAAKLSEAEGSFRNFQYDDALEIAASALEEIEPDALKKINDWVQESIQSIVNE